MKSGGAAALEAGFGKAIEFLALVASVALLAMVAIICADVLTRNVAIPGLPRGVAWSNEVSELLLYAITLLAAPWLLREGRHIRVDIVLRALPSRRMRKTNSTASRAKQSGNGARNHHSGITSVLIESAALCWLFHAADAP